MKIHIITNYYNPEDTFRRWEIDACLIGNEELDCVHQIHIITLLDTELPIESEKFVITRIEENRITYQEAFDYANKNIPEGDIAVLINSDILCTESLGTLTEWVNDEQCVALTRWVPKVREEEEIVQTDGGWRLIPINSSQDLWAFMVPMVPLGPVPDFCLGTPGCDNYIAYILGKSYELRNPAKTIITKHIHRSDERNYPPMIKDYKVRRVNIE